MLFDLLEESPFEVVRLPARTSASKLGMITSVLAREKTMLKICRSFKPDVLAGTDLVITHVAKFFRKKSVVINEDDSAAVPFMAKFAFPYATAILAPHCCDQSPANHKKIGYNGYHELAYLSPKYFMPDKSQLPEKMQDLQDYFILRFAALTAHHDKDKQGIDDGIAKKLIRILTGYGRVFITSERPLPDFFEPYRIAIHPAQMHQALAFAKLYIGDSQTMAAEAAVLGVPGIRFNDFIGKLSYLNELEEKYGLTVGIPAKFPEKLLETVQNMLDTPGLKETWAERREIMLNNTEEVTGFWVKTLEKMAAGG